MPRDGAHTVDDYAALGVERLDIACRRCPRRGSYSVRSAFQRWGDIKLTDLLFEVAADCPHGKGVDAYDCCGAYYPVTPHRDSVTITRVGESRTEEIAARCGRAADAQ